MSGPLTSRQALEASELSEQFAVFFANQPARYLFCANRL
jgi:hypothetical protein